MPNICVVVPGMPAEENEWFLPYLVDYLRGLQRHAAVRVYALKHPGSPGTYSVHGIPVRSFGMGWIRLQSALLKAVREDHAVQPFTHVHAVWANTAGFLGAMVASDLKLPFAVTMGGEELVDLPSIKYGAMRKWRTKPILRYVFANANAIIAPSSGTAMKLSHRWGVQPEKIHRVWFGADTERFHPPAQQPEGPLHVLSVGGLIPVKRHSLLIKAFAIVMKRLPDARLTIVGEGPLRGKYEALVRSLGLERSVSLPGWIHHGAMPDMYRSAHIAAVTSYHEEIPVALLEALASGLHAVSLNVGIAYDLAETGDFPLTIPDSNPEAVAESILGAWDRQRKAPPTPLTDESLRVISATTTVERMLEVFDTLT